MNGCACGCGGEINPMVKEVHRLAATGLGVVAIGRTLGIDRSYTGLLLHKPPRFIKGHSARVQIWRRANCLECGNAFSRLVASDRRYERNYCGKEDCRLIAWYLDRKAFKSAARLSAKRKEREMYLWRRGAYRTIAWMVRLFRVLYRRFLARWKAAQRTRLRELKAAQRTRLRELQQRQRLEREAPLFHGGMVSIYAKIRGNHFAGQAFTLEQTGVMADDSQNPEVVFLAQERATELRRLIGPLEFERLDEPSRQWIRTKLAAAGYHTTTKRGLTVQGIAKAWKPRRKTQQPFPADTVDDAFSEGRKDWNLGRT